jgi:hypothetical protein
VQFSGKADAEPKSWIIGRKSGMRFSGKADAEPKSWIIGPKSGVRFSGKADDPKHYDGSLRRAVHV